MNSNKLKSSLPKPTVRVCLALHQHTPLPGPLYDQKPGRLRGGRKMGARNVGA